MHEVLVNRLGGLSLPRKSVASLTDRPDVTLDVYRGRKTTIQQQPSSKAIGQLVLERKIFKGFTAYGRDGHLGHVTLLICINVHSDLPISFLSNLSPRSNNDLDLCYSFNVNNSLFEYLKKV